MQKTAFRLNNLALEKRRLAKVVYSNGVVHAVYPTSRHVKLCKGFYKPLEIFFIRRAMSYINRGFRSFCYENMSLAD